MDRSNSGQGEGSLTRGAFLSRRCRMIEDPDLCRAAKLISDQQGEDAVNFAAGRAVELLNDGDADGAVVWRRIHEAIGELRRGRLDGGAVN